MRNPEACLSLPPAALQLSPSFGLDTEWEILAGTWPLRPGCPPGAHSLRAHHAAALSCHSAHLRHLPGMLCGAIPSSTCGPCSDATSPSACGARKGFTLSLPPHARQALGPCPLCSECWSCTQTRMSSGPAPPSPGCTSSSQQSSICECRAFLRTVGAGQGQWSE